MFNLKSSITAKDTRGKYIFWDIDGTLAPYRFNGRVSDLPGYFDSKCPDIENGILRYREPTKFMQKLLPTCGAKEHFVLGHYVHNVEITDKHVWLDEHYPYIKRRIFIRYTCSKAEALKEFCHENDIPLRDVIFVDDTASILKEVEACGIESWHISSFMDWFM